MRGEGKEDMTGALGGEKTFGSLCCWRSEDPILCHLTFIECGGEWSVEGRDESGVRACSVQGRRLGFKGVLCGAECEGEYGGMGSLHDEYRGIESEMKNDVECGGECGMK